MNDPLDQAKFVLDLLVLAVGVGYWAGERKAEKRRRDTPPPVAPVAKSESSNGAPTLGEITRRVIDLEHTALTRAESDARFEAVWHEIKNLRTVDDAARRRIDGLLGT